MLLANILFKSKKYHSRPRPSPLLKYSPFHNSLLFFCVYCTHWITVRIMSHSIETYKFFVSLTFLHTTQDWEISKQEHFFCRENHIWVFSSDLIYDINRQEKLFFFVEILTNIGSKFFFFFFISRKSRLSIFLASLCFKKSSLPQENTKF